MRKTAQSEPAVKGQQVPLAVIRSIGGISVKKLQTYKPDSVFR
jgi:hypothetical protein